MQCNAGSPERPHPSAGYMLLPKWTRIQAAGINQNPMFSIVSSEIEGSCLSLQRIVSILRNVAPVVAIDGQTDMGLWLDRQIPVDVEAPCQVG